MKTDRINAFEAAPEAMDAMMAVETRISESSLEKALIQLVKMRASQINGCAFCLDMHSRDARAAGETEQRLYLLNAWREAHVYSARERAALGWTEALTQIYETHAPDGIYEEARPHFDDTELAILTTLIGQINAWNRLAIGLRYHHR